MKWIHEKEKHRWTSMRGDVRIKRDPITEDWVVYVFTDGKMKRESAWKMLPEAKAHGQTLTHAGEYLLTIDPNIERNKRPKKGSKKPGRKRKVIQKP